MSEQEFRDWMKQNGFEAYTDAFITEKLLDKAILSSLTEADLEKIGVSAMGDRKRLLMLFSQEHASIEEPVKEPAKETENEPVVSVKVEEQKTDKDEKPKSNHTFLTILIILVFAAGVIGVSNVNSEYNGGNGRLATSYLYENNSSDAYYMMQKFMEDILTAPKTAKYPSRNDPGVSISRNGTTYTVKAYVDSQNAFGAMIRTRFTMTLEQVSNTNWRYKGMVEE